MTRAQALTAARVAGYENDRAAFTRLIVEQRVNREAMNRAWQAGRTLAAAGLTWRRPTPDDDDQGGKPHDQTRYHRRP